MDDFDLNTLRESRNDYCIRLYTILTPLIMSGFKSIFDEACKLCKNNNEDAKYLMTFQNFLGRIPKWSAAIVNDETNRIIEESRIKYLDTLITCVHMICLKMLTSVRSSQRQKKIDLQIPEINVFIHNVYINCAREIYKNVYLYRIDVDPLTKQKNNKELELIIKEAILNTVRENIPLESVLKAYLLDETIEEDVIEEIKEEIIEKKPMPTQTQSAGKATTHNHNNHKPNNIGFSEKQFVTENVDDVNVDKEEDDDDLESVQRLNILDSDKESVLSDMDDLLTNDDDAAVSIGTIDDIDDIELL